MYTTYATVAFTEKPTTQNVVPGAQAVYRCQYLLANITLEWEVNDSFLGRDYPEDITPGTTRDGNDKLVYTLTITGRPKYNGTRVVCVALFNDGRPNEETEPAFLIGTADINMLGITIESRKHTPLFCMLALGKTG